MASNYNTMCITSHFLMQDILRTVTVMSFQTQADMHSVRGNRICKLVLSATKRKRSTSEKYVGDDAIN